MNPPDREQLKALAHAIEAARARGDIGEADRLVGLFNDLIANAPAPVAAPTEPAQPEAFQSESSEPGEPRIEDMLANAQKEVPPPEPEPALVLAHYPESLHPLVENFLTEASREVQVPKGVLAPMFDEEFRTFFSQKLIEEPLLERLPEDAQLRSILTRYHDDLLEVIKSRNS